MRCNFLFGILLLINAFTHAQIDIEFCNEIEDRRALRNFNNSIELLSSGKLVQAEDLLMRILTNNENFTEAWVALSEIYYTRYENSRNYNEKERLLLQYINCVVKINKTCPPYNNYQTNYILGTYFDGINEKEKAYEYFKNYIELGSKNNPSYSIAKERYKYLKNYFYLINNPVPFEPKLVRGVSSVDSEYLPLISPDGTMAFFTRHHKPQRIGSIYLPEPVEEFMVAYAVDNDGLAYTGGKPMPYPFNTGRHQGASTITIDNTTMYLTICESSARCNIFSTTNRGESWTALKDLGPNINGRLTWESQPSISADGRTLYFSSIRESNIGFNPLSATSDIYYSTKDDNGNWTPAKNIGNVINTSGNEKTPYIHSDSQTLYFASDGHPGLGGYDIFYSRFRDGQWTKPVNIGYPINTKYDDLSFVVNTTGDMAYFASNQLQGKGGWDIYAFELYEEARPERVFFAKGQILDEKGEGLKNARLELRNTRTQKTSEGMVNLETGRYAIVVTIEPEQKDDFLIVVKREEHLFTSKLVNPIEDEIDSPIEIDFEVKPIEVGQTAELNDIYFATASYHIDNKSLAVLDSFIEFLEENTDVKIQLRGHTDNVGGFNTNMILSENRAKNVYDYLVNKGISKNRLKYKGYGPTKPVATNDTEEGRAKNRRTEFIITGK